MSLACTVLVLFTLTVLPDCSVFGLYSLAGKQPYSQSARLQHFWLLQCSVVGWYSACCDEKPTPVINKCMVVFVLKVIILYCCCTGRHSAYPRHK